MPTEDAGLRRELVETKMELAHLRETQAEAKGKIEVMSEQVKNLQELVKALADTINRTMVTRPEFTPVKLIAYGMVGSVLGGVLAAVMALVIKR